MNKKGFSLIELLVVIAIVSLLSAIAMASLSHAQKQARDARRETDLATIKVALESYFNDYHEYPAGITPGSPLTDSTGEVYLKEIPSEPSSTGNYCYNYDKTADQFEYTLGAHFETKPATCP